MPKLIVTLTDKVPLNEKYKLFCPINDTPMYYRLWVPNSIQSKEKLQEIVKTVIEFIYQHDGVAISQDCILLETPWL